MNRYDTIQEVGVGWENSTPKEVYKYNHNHDALGRFASANGGTSGSVSGVGNTKKQTQHKSPSADFFMVDRNADFVSEELGVSKEDATKMVQAINDYSGESYSAIRKASRGENDEYKAEADAMEDFISKSPKWAGGRLYRGMFIAPVSNKRKELLSNAAEGKPIDMLGLSSWTSNKEVAEKFGGHFDASIYFVTNGKETNRGTSIRHLSRKPEEDEVLVSGKAKFYPTKIEVVKIENADGHMIYIYGDIK